MSSSTCGSGPGTGWRFPIAYLTDSLRARRAGKRWYDDNRFEKEAREVASRRGPHA